MSDLIDRQAATKRILERTPFKSKHELMQRINSSIADENGWLGGIAESLDEIEDLPAVDAVPVVHGYWKEDPGIGCFWICSACGYPSEAFAANVLYKYCPRCGAKMEEQNG